MRARLSSDFWVAAYRARLMQQGIPAHIVRRGDQTSGAIIVKVAFMNGRASCYARSTGPDGKSVWAPLSVDEAEAAVDDMVTRQATYDPDVWVVEVEDPRGRHLLNRDDLEA